MYRKTSRRQLLATTVCALSGAFETFGWDRSALGFDHRFSSWPEEFYPTTKFLPPADTREFHLRTAHTMGWAAQLAYEVGDSADEQNKVALILSRWGWTLRGFCSNTNSELISARAARGYIADADGVTVLAFSGTEPTSLSDWATNLDASYSNDEEIHDGFAASVAQIEDKIKFLLGAGTTALTNCLYITGHSLGGALAVVMAFRLIQAGAVRVEQTQIVTFGMPRVGTEKFAALYRACGLGDSTIRLVHGRDLVPMLPPYNPLWPRSPRGFRHVGNSLACSELGAFDLKALVPDGPESQPPDNEVGTAQMIYDGLIAWEPFNSGPDFPGVPGAQLLPWPIRDHLADLYLLALSGS